jgi:hypothetical protein
MIDDAGDRLFLALTSEELADLSAAHTGSVARAGMASTVKPRPGTLSLHARSTMAWRVVRSGVARRSRSSRRLVWPRNRFSAAITGSASPQCVNYAPSRHRWGARPILHLGESPEFSIGFRHRHYNRREAVGQ